jgi:3-oxoacyl-[acyl-carrier-protein] synthase-3
MAQAKIMASGSYLPHRVVTNAELVKLMPSTSSAWIEEKIGIRERRFANPGQGVSDLALLASQKALVQAQLIPSDIDAIVFATATPEYHAPGSGVLLQNKLGCRPIPAFDVRNTSPGFLYSLDLADGLIKSGRYRTVLVVGAEVHSSGLDFSDRGRMMSVIFGDGAGCFILRAEKGDSGLCDFVLHSDGQYFDKLWCESPFGKATRVYPQMEGRFVFEKAVSCMSSAVKELLVKNKVGVGDVDWFLSHQANLRIIEAIGQNLNLKAQNVPHNIEKYGNTSSASIPILFDELNCAGKFQTGQKIVMMSFGSGFCWGAGLVFL